MRRAGNEARGQWDLWMLNIVSGLAMRIGGTMWWLFHPESQQLSFPSRSDGHAQVWSYCWTYLHGDGDGMGKDSIGAHGGSIGA